VTLAKKGRRAIAVSGEDFHWLVQRTVAPRPDRLDALTLTLVVQRATGQGSRLQARFEGTLIVASPAKGFDDEQSLTLKPDLVRRVIERALGLGWKAEDADVTLQHQEREFPEAETPLVGDGSYDPAKLDTYLATCTLVWKKP
jgi:hypothetical protein